MADFIDKAKHLVVLAGSHLSPCFPPADCFAGDDRAIEFDQRLDAVTQRLDGLTVECRARCRATRIPVSRH